MWAVDPKYYDLAEVKKESRLWRAAEKKHPWYDAPAKVKVKTKFANKISIPFSFLLPLRGVTNIKRKYLKSLLHFWMF